MSTIIILIGAAVVGLIVTVAVLSHRTRKQLQHLHSELRATQQELEIQRIVLAEPAGAPKKQRHLRALAILTPLLIVLGWIRHHPGPTAGLAGLVSTAAAAAILAQTTIMPAEPSRPSYAAPLPEPPPTVPWPEATTTTPAPPTAMTSPRNEARPRSSAADATSREPAATTRPTRTPTTPGATPKTPPDTTTPPTDEPDAPPADTYLLCIHVDASPVAALQLCIGGGKVVTLAT